MADDRRPEWAPFDQAKLLLVRDFLHREFRSCEHRDFVALDPTAQVFIIETARGVRRTLIIPKATFDADLSALLNTQLVDALQHARDGHITLTPDGLDVRP